MKKFLSIIALLMAFAATGFADTWTVAGNAAALNGDDSWAAGNADNDMTSEDGTNFTLTVTDCTLEVGTTYEFKVVKNHSWNEAYPGSNYQFTVDETAVYTVVYTFNASTHDIDVITTKTGEAGEITHTYTVAGSSVALFGSTWAPGETANDMVVLEGNYYIWQKENVELDANFEFKVCVDHSWALSYPADNYGVELSNGPGYYDVQIIFDAENHTINCVCALRSVEISSVVFSYGVAEQDWSNLTLVKGDDGKYTATLDLSEVLSNQDFKLNIDNDTWLGTNQLYLIAPENVVTVPDGIGDGQNFTLLNATSGFKTYTITAEWESSADASAGWTLTIEGGEQRTVYHSSVTFATGLNWNKVYAYVWKDDNGEITNIVEWPGIEMTVTDEEVVSCGEHFPVYGLALESFVDVNKVIFNDGTIDDPEEGVNKTGVEEYQDAIPYRYMIPEPAEISSVVFSYGEAGAQNWTDLTLVKGDDGKYTAELDLSNVLINQDFKLNINAGTWLGTNQLTLDAGNLVTVPDNIGDGQNFTLLNATSDFKTYTITAEWTPSVSASAGWTLTIAGKDARPYWTYSLTFVDGANWGNVYAYIWNGTEEAQNIVELNGGFPGQPMTKEAEKVTVSNVEYDLYSYTLKTYVEGEPQHILFSDGTDAKKDGPHDFIPNVQYQWTVPMNASITKVELVGNGFTSPLELTGDGNIKTGTLDLSTTMDNPTFKLRVNNDIYLGYMQLTPDGDLITITDNTPEGGDFTLLNRTSGFQTYTVTATWKPNPVAANLWTLKIEGADERVLLYYVISPNSDNMWVVEGDAMTETEGVLTAAISGAGKLFAIAPIDALTATETETVVDWSKVVRPVTTGNDFLVDYFVNYADATCSGHDGNVWKIAENNNSLLTLSYTPAEDKFAITTGATETLAIGAAGYATYSNDKRFTVSGDDVEVYFVEEVGTNVKMTKKEDAVLPGGSGKGKGILLKGSGDVTISPAAADATDTDVSANLLAGSGNYSYVISGSFGGNDTYNAAYVLKNGDDGIGFYYINLSGSETDRTLAPNKAFLAFNSAGAPGFIGFDEMSTGIRAIENGQLTNGYIYSLDGQRVTQPTKGVYIINGKKVLVK